MTYRDVVARKITTSGGSTPGGNRRKVGNHIESSGKH